jgi:hypothetical protein
VGSLALAVTESNSCSAAIAVSSGCQWQRRRLAACALPCWPHSAAICPPTALLPPVLLPPVLLPPTHHQLQPLQVGPTGSQTL